MALGVPMSRKCPDQTTGIAVRNAYGIPSLPVETPKKSANKEATAVAVKRRERNAKAWAMQRSGGD